MYHLTKNVSFIFIAANSLVKYLSTKGIATFLVWESLHTLHMGYIDNMLFSRLDSYLNKNKKWNNYREMAPLRLRLR
jgi:hypothetical protein